MTSLARDLTYALRTSSEALFAIVAAAVRMPITALSARAHSGAGGVQETVTDASGFERRKVKLIPVIQPAPQRVVQPRQSAGWPSASHPCVPALVAVCLLCLTCLFHSPVVSGQVVTASLQGTVQDNSGAVVPNVLITVTNTSTNTGKTAKTGSNGRFVFPYLLPGGPYSVTAVAAGFKTEVRSGIRLEVNQQAEITMVLAVGAATQQVTVTANASQLETTTAAMGQVIGNQDIVNLPLNLRNVYSLMFLIPGVTGTVTDTYNGLNLSVDGGRPGSSEILIDGIPAAPHLSVAINGFSVFPSVDAVQEFKVQTTGYSAEFGRSGSGIVNVILKSGTNQLHGSAYEFLRNSALDANTFFNNRKNTPLPLLHRSQFGASATGPVLIPKLYNGRDKTFFLFSYEGLRQATPSDTTTTVPTALQAAGDFSQTFNSAGALVNIYDPATTTYNSTTKTYTRETFTQEYNEGPGNMAYCGGHVNCIPANRFDSVAANVIKYYPPPNQPGTITGANNFFNAGATITNIDEFDSRVDETFNDHNRMFVSYSQRNYQVPILRYFPKAYQAAQQGANATQAANSAAIDFTHDFGPSFVMEIPIGFSRTVALSEPIGSFDPTQLGFPSYIASNARQLLFPGFQVSSYIGLGGANPNVIFANLYTIGVRNTKVYGNHVFSFGGEARLSQVNESQTSTASGSYSFTQAITQGPNASAGSITAGNAFASLLLGVGASGNFPIQAVSHQQNPYYAAYFQDNWKASPKLSLNLGLRYNLDLPATSTRNEMNTFNPSLPSPLASQTGLTGLTGGLVFAGVDGNSRRMEPTTYRDFDPRAGLSYEINRDTVIRASYGIYHLPGWRAASGNFGQVGYSASTSYVGNSALSSTSFTYLSDPFPSGINHPSGNSLGALTGIGSRIPTTPLTGDKVVGYMQQWELDIQRQLPGSFLVDVAYVGTHGVHLNKSVNGNWPANQLTPASLALGTGLEASKPNPFYGIITTGPESSATIAESYLQAPFPQFTEIELYQMTGGFEEYNSFQLKVNKRMSHGLDMLVSFTGQKQIDDSSGIENEGNITGGNQNIYDPRGERAVSSNDISRSLVVSGIYQLPFGRGQRFGANWNRPLNGVLGGWQINGIATEQDGFPLSPTTADNSDSGHLTERPNVVAGVNPAVSGPVKNKLNHYVNSAAFSIPAAFTFGDAPRTLSNVRAPGVHNIDFSAFKSFHATEKMTVEFRAESFNLLNQVQFGPPNMVLTSGQFGVISSQKNTPRQIQAAMKVLW